MRIAIVCPYALSVPGGVQDHAINLANYLWEGGDEIAIISPGHRDCKFRTITVGSSIGIKFNQSVAPIALHPATWPRTTAALLDFAPDIVHVHEPLSPLVSVAALKQAESYSIVATFHSWSSRSTAYGIWGSIFGRRLRSICKHIAVSPPARDFHSRALNIDPDQFVVIPNGVNVAAYSESEESRERARVRSGHRVLFLGRLDERKGLDVLLHAMPIVNASTIDVSLDIAGGGPNLERYKALASTLGLDNVSFHGRVSDDAKVALLRNCDVFVSPATGGESFGIVLVEAMAAGTAIAASDIVAHRAVLKNGRYGELFAPHDSTALATALVRLLRSEALRKRYIAASNESIASYDWANVGAKVRDVYQRALDS